jgi:diacylglycerol kinase (ATP)
MQITLMHNPKAGRGAHGEKDLVAALTHAGHKVTYQSTKEPDYKKALKKPADLVVVAGGDGSVGKIARRLMDSGIPMSVLPLGTANNVARSLGFVGEPEQIIAGLARGRKRVFDMGAVTGACGERYVVEGAGAGLLADYIQADETEAKKNRKSNKNEHISREQEMARHVALMRRLLHDHAAQSWKIEIDGEDISGSYLLWEAMNIRSVGPGLYFAPRAATRDGKFEFACVREEDRDTLLKYFDARLAKRRAAFPVPTRKFRHLRVAWNRSVVHFDDKIWPAKKDRPRPGDIEITVQSSALIILQPGHT